MKTICSPCHYFHIHWQPTYTSGEYHYWFLWNAKLTETQIFSELSFLLASLIIQIESNLNELSSSLIKLESYLFEWESSLIQLESYLIQLKSSLIQIERSLYLHNHRAHEFIFELSNCMKELSYSNCKLTNSNSFPIQWVSSLIQTNSYLIQLISSIIQIVISLIKFKGKLN